MGLPKGHKINVGRVRSEEFKRKVKENHAHYWLGKRRGPRNNEVKEKIRKKLIGHPVSQETRRKIGERNKTRKHYPQSFSSIFQRNKLQSFEEALSCQELWNINNGRTLCIDCHKKTSNYLKRESAT
jgi:hypothetical protein